MSILVVFNKNVILSSIGIAICAWILNDWQTFNSSNTKTVNKHLFNSETLAKYDGIQEKNIYLAILGSVFDVSEGAKHYLRPSPYHYFAGKDGSRSFVTGDFTNDSDDKDHIMDLSCTEIKSIITWESTLKNKYIYKGKLIGRYYNKDGDPTEYFDQLIIKLNNCKQESITAEELKKKFPPCNVEWDADKGTKVWCSKESGGIKRSWVGVPRQLFKPDWNNPSCVCMDPLADNSGALYKEYQNCNQEISYCYVKT